MADDVADLYDALAADYHRIFVDWDAAIARQGAALAALLAGLGVASGARVLDCTCGIGTQALGLAAHGYRVHGTDLSAGAIERARREAAARRLDASFAVADVRLLATQVAGSFAAVVSCDNSLAHLADDAELVQAFRGITARMAPRGVVAVSVRDYDRLAVARPAVDPPRVSGSLGARGVTLQLWDWDDDGDGYRLDQILLRERAGGWDLASYPARLRALRRVTIDAALAAAGLAPGRWHEPADSGYYQPLVTTTQPSGVV